MVGSVLHSALSEHVALEGEFSPQLPCMLILSCWSNQKKLSEDLDMTYIYIYMYILAWRSTTFSLSSQRGFRNANCEIKSGIRDSQKLGTKIPKDRGKFSQKRWRKETKKRDRNSQKIGTKIAKQCLQR